MASHSPPTPAPPGRFPAHDGAALLSLGGALVLQTAWPAIAGRSPGASYWPYDGLVVAAATVFLLATAWLHLAAARWPPSELTPRLWQLGRALPADVAVIACALYLFLQGPESSTQRAGLWLLTPVLLTVSTGSAVVIGLALRGGVRHLANRTPPQNVQPRGQFRDLTRALIAIALLAAIVRLERHEPSARPWEPPPAESANLTSPPAGNPS